MKIGAVFQESGLNVTNEFPQKIFEHLISHFYIFFLKKTNTIMKYIPDKT